MRIINNNRCHTHLRLFCHAGSDNVSSIFFLEYDNSFKRLPTSHLLCMCACVYAIQANHGDPTEAEAKLCRPRKIVLEDNVEQTCEDSDPWCRIVAVGNASVLLNFGVITAVDNIAELPDTFACIPMYLGNNSTGEDLHKFKHVPFDGVSTDPSCDVFWREVLLTSP